MSMVNYGEDFLDPNFSFNKYILNINFDFILKKKEI